MQEFEITKIGERGQVVIPQSVRKQMSLNKGEKLIVIQKEGLILFKRLEPPKLEDFEKLLKKTHEHAKKHRLTEKDMWTAIKKTRA